MQEEIKAGIKGYCEQYVAKTDTAAVYGSGLIEVFATPAMVALMEKAAHTSVGQLLPPGTVTVGSEISVKHLKGTGLGKRVWAETTLTSVAGRRLDFEVAAWDESGQIGQGHHTRFIVDIERFMSKA